jgi:hypothetical protein
VTETITALETAVLLRAFLERLEWRFSLTAEGKLHVIIGDDPPKLPQQQTLALIASLEPEFKVLLADRTVH